MLILAYVLLGLGALLLLGSTVAIIGGARLASPAGLTNLLSLPLVGVGVVLSVVAGVSMNIAVLGLGAPLLVTVLLVFGALIGRSA